VSALATASLTFKRPIVPIWNFVLQISDFVRRIALSGLADCADLRFRASDFVRHTGFSRLTDCADRALSRNPPFIQFIGENC
jgi:hypothetical protein